MYLRVSDNGSRRWELRYTSPVTGKRVDMGLGSANKGHVGLAAARELAASARELVAKGLDPVVERDRQRSERAAQATKTAPKTFGKVAEELLNGKIEENKNAKHRAQWRSTLVTYAKPLWHKDITEITEDDIVSVLRPLLEGEKARPETGRRVQQRIARVLAAGGRRGSDNPATWRGALDSRLPTKRPKTVHRPAMLYEHAPAFVAELRKRTSISARALEFLILTAARSGEVRGMTWSELNEEHTTWTVPGDRMKAGNAHRVPLTSRAQEILKEMDRLRPENRPMNGFVFPGARIRTRSGALSDMTLTKLLRDMRDAESGDESDLRKLLLDATGNPVVVHGFRSTFRDWAEDVARFPARVVEHALAHTIKDKAEAAYRRGDAFEQRRELMDAWDSYLIGASTQRTDIAT